MSRESPKKNWCFTFNNYPESLLEFNQVLSDVSNYWIYGKEVCPTTGTPHLQGYIQLKDKVRLKTLKDQVPFPRVRWDGANGTAAHNVTYCSKDGQVSSFGTIIDKGQRSDLTAMCALIAGGAKKRKIAEEMPEMVVKYSRGIEALLSWRSGWREWKTEVFWFYGPTGTGKSHRANAMAPSAYMKMKANKWWDGYEGEEDVIIEDYRCDFSTFSELLVLFDKYRLRIEYKGGSQPMLAKRIFITTPKSPQETWASRTEEDVAQLMRRIENIYYFNQPWHHTCSDLLCEPIKIK